MAVLQMADCDNATDTCYGAGHTLEEKLDAAIDDVENGRIQTIDRAWEDIDSFSILRTENMMKISHKR